MRLSNKAPSRVFSKGNFVLVYPYSRCNLRLRHGGHLKQLHTALYPVVPTCWPVGLRPWLARATDKPSR